MSYINSIQFETFIDTQKVLLNLCVTHRLFAGRWKYYGDVTWRYCVPTHGQLDCLLNNLFRLTKTKVAKACITERLCGESAGDHMTATELLGVSCE